jgi:hypothetical protein
VIILRLVGWVLLLAGLMVLGRDLVGWWDVGAFAPVSLDELWRDLNRASYVKIHGAFAPALLRLWAAPAIALPGLILIWFGRFRRTGTRRRRRSTRRPS